MVPCLQQKMVCCHLTTDQILENNCLIYFGELITEIICLENDCKENPSTHNVATPQVIRVKYNTEADSYHHVNNPEG